MNSKPKCIIVTGRAGAGKTTLSKKLGRQLWMPVISRDEIKEGYVNTFGVKHDRLPPDINGKVTDFFFEIVCQYLAGSVSIVIEAAFQHPVWESRMPRILELSHPFIILCFVDEETAAQRHLQRGLADPRREFYHEDKRVALYRATGEIGTPQPYVAPNFDVPTIQVSTENDYAPNFDEITRQIQSQMPDASMNPAAVKNMIEEMNKPALFIIDMLNDSFTSEELSAKRAALCHSINELLLFARKNRFHIIWVRQEFKADLSDAFLEMRDENIEMYIEGTFGSQIIEELQKMDDEREIIKKRYSAFFRTNLDDLPKRINPPFLVLAGVNTHACIRTAAVDAYQLDYRVQLISDCVASPDQRHHDVTLDYLERISKIVKLDKFKEEFNAVVTA